jgi:hypothetical protein
MLPRLYRRAAKVLLYLPVASVSLTGCLGGITSRCGLGSGGEVVPAMSFWLQSTASTTTHHTDDNA